MNKSIKYFANLYFKLQILLLFILLGFLIYSFFFLEQSISVGRADKFNFFINNSLLFFVLLISCLVYFFIKEVSKKENYFLIHFSTIFSLFILNLLFEIKSIYFLPDNTIVQFEKKGVKWDKRNHNKVVADLKKQTGDTNIYKVTNPQGFIVGNIAEKISFNNEIKPLGNISNSTIVHCNESGIWQSFQSDNFGFNNPKKILNTNKKTELLLLGDSFTEGACVGGGNDIGSKLRNLNYNVLNLGKAGGGVIFGQARLREYKDAYDFNPKFVVYLFYSYNDVTDTEREYNHPFFKKYLSNINFSQDLKNKQKKVDIFWKKFFSLTSKPDFLEKYPSLKKYGQFHFSPEEKINYAFHIKRIFLLNNIRGFIHNKLIVNITNTKFNEKKNQLNILKKAFISFRNEVRELNNDTKFIVAYLPSHPEIVNKNPHLRKEIKKLTNELNVDFINVYDSFVKKDLNDLFDYGLNGHYSSNGYKLLADIIDEHLLEKYRIK